MKKTTDFPTVERMLMIAVARLRSDGKQQKEIASALGISQPKVSRLVGEALDASILGSAPPVIRKNITDEEWQSAGELCFPQDKVLTKLNQLMPAGVHFRVRQLPGNYDKFICTAAAHVCELLRNSHLIGIMWGQTIAKLVQEVSQLTKTSETHFNKTLEFIPLCGDPVHLMNQWEVEYSASRLAAELEKCLAATRRADLPCLSGVPAYISPRLLHNREFKEFLNSIPGYHRIFASEQKNGDRPLIERVDTVVTGVGIIVNRSGSKDHETAAFIRERIEQSECSKDELSKIILGDIGGLLIGKSPSGRKRVAELNEGWIGMRQNHFLEIARRSRKSGPPGVIVVASGAEKANMITEIVKRGYVNNLLVDNMLGNALLELKH